MPQTRPTFVCFHLTMVWTLFFSGITGRVRHQTEIYSSPRPDGCPFDSDEEKAELPFGSQRWTGFATD